MHGQSTCRWFIPNILQAKSLLLSLEKFTFEVGWGKLTCLNFFHFGHKFQLPSNNWISEKNINFKHSITYWNEKVMFVHWNNTLNVRIRMHWQVRQLWQSAAIECLQRAEALSELCASLFVRLYSFLYLYLCFCLYLYQQFLSVCICLRRAAALLEKCAYRSVSLYSILYFYL